MEMRPVILLLCSFSAVSNVQGWWSEWTSLSPWTTGDYTENSCRYNCGYNLGSCSCTDYCQYYGNCCRDYHDYCYTTTAAPSEPTTQNSCGRYNCGNDLGSCSCRSSCRYYGNCCHDYYDYCYASTAAPPQPTTPSPPTSAASYSCRWYNCGSDFGSCSCRSSCQYYGNCCHDYYDYCYVATTTVNTPTVSRQSCMNKCGYNFSSCSCLNSCENYGNCCYDYYAYCSGTAGPAGGNIRVVNGNSSCSGRVEVQHNGIWGTVCDDNWDISDANVVCRQIGCGQALSSPHMAYFGQGNGQIWLDDVRCTGHESSLFQCAHNGFGTHNCGHSEDASVVCQDNTPQCGGDLYGSGTFSSPYYPGYYHENAYCVWKLSVPSGQRILLTFSDLELEHCCDCDYITVHNGPSTAYHQMGRLCYNSTLDIFHSSSNYLTVVFRSNYAVVGRGFQAQFISSLSSNQGRVQCSSDNMEIVISRSFLSNQGYYSHDLYVNDENCRPTVSSSQVVFTFHLNSCGTVKKFVNGRIIYENAVRAYQISSGEITRQSSQFQLSVACHMERDSVSQIMYIAKEATTFNITGIGRFNTTMAFYTSSSFYQQIYQNPYYVTLNQYMYVQVNLMRDDSSLVLFLDTCVATPNPYENTNYRAYYLLENGCQRDSTYYSYLSGSTSYARFRFQAFKFLRTHNTVYLQCKVLICPANDYNSRCRDGCRSRKARSLNSEHQTATIVLGPIKLKDVENSGVKQPEDSVAKVDV